MSIDALMYVFDSQAAFVGHGEKVARKNLLVSELWLDSVLSVPLNVVFRLVVVYFADVEVQLDEFEKSHSQS